MKKNSTHFKFIVSFLLLFLLNNSYAQQTVVSVKVDTAPTVDGIADDPAWLKAKQVVTHDSIANIDIRLKTVYTRDEIFFLVQFEDKTENRLHKKLQWNKEKKLYTVGPLREDSVVLKWNMEAFPVNLKLGSENNYKADIWYWKSYRTDHAGFADDKYHVYNDVPSAKAQTIISNSGKSYFLTRKGDKGVSAYKNIVPITYSSDQVPGYELRKPQGSRADIKARGNWKNGVWTVEFSRKLDTGNIDDIYLEPGLLYGFGVSRFEIAGRLPDKSIEEPLFGSGDISESLILEFR